MEVNSISSPLSILWDRGASISLITFQKARELKLKGKKIELLVAKVGGQVEKTSSFMHSLPLIDKNNKMVSINVYGIERISRVDQDHITSIIHMFKGVTQWEAPRPGSEVNVLIRFN